jgi:uncharacterized protein (DUF2164 family)
MDNLITAVAAYKAIDHYVTSADARLSYRADSERLEYLRMRATMQSEDSRRMAEISQRIAREGQYFNSEQAELERSNQRYLQADALFAQKVMSDQNREAMLTMHANALDQQERLEVRRLRVQFHIAKQEQKLQKYLFDQGIKSSFELEKFRALAMRETQILLARENAQMLMHDSLVKDALKEFPLNISPIVLLRNASNSLSGLLRFSTKQPEKALPPISKVYDDVKEYSKNPEAINVFIAPIYIDSKIQNRELLSQQIWDSVYQNVESFFIEHYNGQSDHSAILYPTAWKDKSVAGQHASETLHFFLKDIPCIVLEPRFDGQSFSIMLSSWGIGYASTDHIRVELKFDLNLDTLLIQSAYNRSIKSLKLIEELGDEANNLLANQKKQLEQNIEYYNLLQLGSEQRSKIMDEISSLGVYNLFHIDPVRDMEAATEAISSLISINLAIMTDVHHLQCTDATPILPQIFKTSFPNIYNNLDLRKEVFKCYEKIYIYLRNEDASTVDPSKKREMERIREMQIENLKKAMELINEAEIKSSVEDKLRKYASERFNGVSQNDDIDSIWERAIEQMTLEDVVFFRELLPNITDRRLYKKLDRRLSELNYHLS